MWLIVAAVVVLGVAWAWWRWGGTYHFVEVEPGALYRDGNRSLHQFSEALKRSRCRTVVTLVDDDEMSRPPFSGEAEACREAGVELVRVPVRLGGWPDSDQVRRFLEIATDPARRPVLVHCAQGVRRTGMMVAAYQESVLGYDAERAKREILRFGHSDRTVSDVRRFIDIYDPAARTVTSSMPQSVE
jgi:protein tyrosine/serine phosphatase